MASSVECLQDQSRSFKKYVRHGEGEGVLKKPTKTSTGEGREGGQAYLYVPSVKKIAKQTYAEAGKGGTYKTIREEQGGRGSKIEVLSERTF